MKEVKTPKKPLIDYYGIVLLVLIVFNLVVSPILMEHQVEETDYGTFTYYPGVLSGTSQWWGDMVFAASEEIVLKRDADQGPEPAAVKSVRHLSMPERVTVNLGASPAVDNRRAVAERLMR